MNWTCGYDLQAIRVHRLARVELEILEVRKQLLLDKGLSTFLESCDLIGRGTLLHEVSLDRLEVAYRNTDSQHFTFSIDPYFPAWASNGNILRVVN